MLEMLAITHSCVCAKIHAYIGLMPALSAVIRIRCAPSLRKQPINHSRRIHSICSIRNTISARFIIKLRVARLLAGGRKPPWWTSRSTRKRTGGKTGNPGFFVRRGNHPSAYSHPVISVIESHPAGGHGPGKTGREFFSPAGILSKAKNFEFRPQQQEMAVAVARALQNGEHLAVEAGTGVGKSLAYLIPAILFAVARKKRPSFPPTPSICRSNWSKKICRCWRKSCR